MIEQYNCLDKHCKNGCVQLMQSFLCRKFLRIRCVIMMRKITPGVSKPTGVYLGCTGKPIYFTPAFGAFLFRY